MLANNAVIRAHSADSCAPSGARCAAGRTLLCGLALAAALGALSAPSVAFADEPAPEEPHRKLKLPDAAKESPAYVAASNKKAGGVLGLTLGGISVGIGLIWLATSSIRIFTDTPPNTGGQIGGGTLMGLGTVGMVVGGTMLSIGRDETKRFEDQYFLRAASGFTVNVGAGSVMLSGSF